MLSLKATYLLTYLTRLSKCIWERAASSLLAADPCPDSSIVQSYFPGGANVHAHLPHDSIGPPHSASQTAARSVQPFLHDRVQKPHGAEYCDERVCLSVCSHMSGTTRPNYTNFGCIKPVAVARSSSDGVVMRTILPVLWMTSCLFIVGPAMTTHVV